MWKILKAEFSYNKLGLSIGFGILTLFFAGTLYFDSGGVYSLMMNTGVGYMIAMGVIASESDKEKRDRFLSLLPNSIKQLAVARLFFLILFQFGIFCLWFIVYLIEHFGKDSNAIWTMLFANGSILFIITLFVIYSDLGFYGTKKYKILFSLILLVIILVVSFHQQLNLNIFRLIEIKDGMHIVAFYKNLVRTPEMALLSNLFCLGLLYLSAAIFIRRRSYIA